MDALFYNDHRQASDWLIIQEEAQRKKINEAWSLRIDRWRGIHQYKHWAGGASAEFVQREFAKVFARVPDVTPDMIELLKHAAPYLKPLEREKPKPQPQPQPKVKPKPKPIVEVREPDNLDPETGLVLLKSYPNKYKESERRMVLRENYCHYYNVTPNRLPAPRAVWKPHPSCLVQDRRYYWHLDDVPMYWDEDGESYFMNRPAEVRALLRFIELVRRREGVGYSRVNSIMAKFGDCSRQAVNNWCRGLGVPSGNFLCAIADHYRIDLKRYMRKPDAVAQKIKLEREQAHYRRLQIEPLWRKLAAALVQAPVECRVFDSDAEPMLRLANALVDAEFVRQVASDPPHQEGAVNASEMPSRGGGAEDDGQ